MEDELRNILETYKRAPISVMNGNGERTYSIDATIQAILTLIRKREKARLDSISVERITPIWLHEKMEELNNDDDFETPFAEKLCKAIHKLIQGE